MGNLNQNTHFPDLPDRFRGMQEFAHKTGRFSTNSPMVESYLKKSINQPTAAIPIRPENSHFLEGKLGVERGGLLPQQLISNFFSHTVRSKLTVSDSQLRPESGKHPHQECCSGCAGGGGCDDTSQALQVGLRSTRNILNHPHYINNPSRYYNSILSLPNAPTMCLQQGEPQEELGVTTSTPCKVTSYKPVPGMKRCYSYQEGNIVWGNYPNHVFVLYNGIGYGMFPVDTSFFGGGLWGGEAYINTVDHTAYKENECLTKYYSCLKKCYLDSQVNYRSLAEKEFAAIYEQVRCDRKCSKLHDCKKPWVDKGEIYYRFCVPVYVSNCCDTDKFRKGAKKYIDHRIDNPNDGLVIEDLGYILGINDCFEFMKGVVYHGRKACGEPMDRFGGTSAVGVEGGFRY